MALLMPFCVKIACSSMWGQHAEPWQTPWRQNLSLCCLGSGDRDLLVAANLSQQAHASAPSVQYSAEPAQQSCPARHPKENSGYSASQSCGFTPCSLILQSASVCHFVRPCCPRQNNPYTETHAACRLAAALVRLDLAKNEGLEDARKLLAGEAVIADEDEADEEAKPAQEMKDKAGDKPQVMNGISGGGSSSTYCQARTGVFGAHLQQLTYFSGRCKHHVMACMERRPRLPRR